MDSTISRKEALERRHRRALSHNSMASTTYTQTTTKSASTSSSHARSVTPSNAPHAHRYHHSQCDKPLITTATRVPSLLSREPSQGSTQPMTPVSSLLQERLRQERRAESERMASKFAGDRSSSTTGVRDAGSPSSPSRRYKTVIERRPGSSHADDSSQGSMGAKQAEKAVSTLHKQNFDLKLELFHRREKQSVLEARIDELENERRELKDIQKDLLSELVKRDKAIEEAVNMIVKLETRVDELAREREMVLQVEADGSYRDTQWDVSDLSRTDTPKPGDHGRLSSTKLRALERMPSFLSDQSIHTENLRDVVLRNRSSLRHIRKVSEVSSSSADVSEINRIASPSLSILSESSFVSIYGSKAGQENLISLPPEDMSGMDGTLGDRSPTPTRKTMLNSLQSRNTVTNFSSQVLSLNNVLRRDSPLQGLEKIGDQSGLVHDTFRPSTSDRGKDVVTPTPRAGISPSRPRGRNEKREALDKVLTNYPTHKELANSHALPPTPDTVASSVLRKHKNPSSSQDSLVSPDSARFPRALPNSLADSSAYLRSLGSQEARSAMSAQMASAGPRYRPDMGNMAYSHANGDPLLSDLGHLACSAADTPTIRSRADSFVSDSDSDGGADAHSDTETCDYWMRESYKPNGDNCASKNTREQERARSPSPDLFSFPGDSGGWEPDAMFGALKGNGFLGSPVPALKRDPIDEMASSLRTSHPDPLDLQAGGPQPPSRRSSLNAHVAGQFLLSTFSNRANRSSSRDGGAVKPNTKGRSNSIDGAGHRALPGVRADGGPVTKRSQYPPISGLQSRGRGLGLNLLFKRSGSESHGTPPSATESTFPSPTLSHGVPTPQAHLRHVRRPSGRNSVPPPATMPWATRLQEDELQSATPPPIMRNRPQVAQNDLATSEVADPELGQPIDAKASAMGPSTEVEAVDGVAETPAVAPQSGGGMRKWLGLGMKGSTKNRTG